MYNIYNGSSADDETKRKYDDYLEQGLPGSFEILDNGSITLLRANYKKVMGTDPS